VREVSVFHIHTYLDMFLSVHILHLFYSFFFVTFVRSIKHLTDFLVNFQLYVFCIK